MRVCVTLFLIVNVIIIQEVWPQNSNDIDKDIMNKYMNFNGTIRQTYALLLGQDTDLKMNMVGSPICAMLPLVKLLLGVKDQSVTEEEFLTALGIENSKELIRAYVQKLYELRSLPGVIVYLISKMYIPNKHTLFSHFDAAAKNLFESSMDLLNMDDPEAAAKSINDWIQHETIGNMEDTVRKEDITPTSSIILVNVVLFRGGWEKPFFHTYTGDFYTENGLVEMPMMKTSGNYEHMTSERLDAQVVRIPFKGNEICLLIVLPNKKNGLKTLLATFKENPYYLNEAIMNFKMTPLRLKIPIFRIESTLDLKHYYGEMGIQRVFDKDQSELDAIVLNGTAHLSAAVQKAVVDINEHGIGPYQETTTPPPEKVNPKASFEADHPFLYYVKGHSEQLLAGVFVKPEKIEENIN